MYRDLTKGRIGSTLIMFALPMITGNLLQQFYNISDTLIVGQVLGRNALAAVGSAYTLMTFLTSIFLGLCMGSGALFSIYQGRGDMRSLKCSIFHSFCLIMAITFIINIAVYAFISPIMAFLRVPGEVYDDMKIYLLIVFAGIPATSLYNFFSCMLRALGNSSAPLIFLAASAVLNIALDILFVAVIPFGIGGAALATVIAQYISGLGISIYVLIKCRAFLPAKSDRHFSMDILKEILNLSSLTCLQQSVMNFGILMVQGLVNSFGSVVMAAFAAAVKIDTFSYLPVQDFGNIQHHNLCVGIHVRITAHENIYRRFRDTGDCSRCALSSYRRCLLYRNRLSLSVIWLLPRHQKSRNVRHPHSHITRHARLVSIHIIRYRRHRCNRNMAGDSYRMGVSGCDRSCLFKNN